MSPGHATNDPGQITMYSSIPIAGTVNHRCPIYSFAGGAPPAGAVRPAAALRSASCCWTAALGPFLLALIEPQEKKKKVSHHPDSPKDLTHKKKKKSPRPPKRTQDTETERKRKRERERKREHNSHDGPRHHTDDNHKRPTGHQPDPVQRVPDPLVHPPPRQRAVKGVEPAPAFVPDPVLVFFRAVQRHHVPGRRMRHVEVVDVDRRRRRRRR